MTRVKPKHAAANPVDAARLKYVKALERQSQLADASIADPEVEAAYHQAVAAVVAAEAELKGLS